MRKVKGCGCEDAAAEGGSGGLEAGYRLGQPFFGFKECLWIGLWAKGEVETLVKER